MMYQSGNFNVWVMDDIDGFGQKAAEIVAEQINGKKDSVMGFATGGTPVPMYKKLIEMYKAGKVDFADITTFNLDEYYPIKKSNDQSYDYFMKDNLFNHVNVNKDRLHIPNGEAADPEAECLGYEKQIRDAGGVDFQVLGIGLNGHIGFNEPASYFKSITNYVTLTESTIKANARFFASEDEVPKHAISMGIRTIMMAKKILLLVNGAAKADIIYQTVFGNIMPSVPATALQLHQNVSVVLDKEAAAKIESYLK